MTPRLHGGDLARIRQQYPTDRTWIDLSTGINPHGYPWLEKIDHQIILQAGNRLPAKEDYDNCRAAYADYLECDPQKILFAAGSQTLIEKLPMLFCDTEVYILGPTYHEHGRSWNRRGHPVHHLPYSEASLAEIRRGKVVIITSPNNPDGQMIDPHSLYEFCRDYCEKDGHVIIDEAFMDLYPENSLINFDLPSQTYVLRSVGKFFGLAGLRLGAIYAPEIFCQKLISLSTLWNISTLSLVIATHALRDQDWITRTKNKLPQKMAKLGNIITKAGYKIAGKTGLFCLIEGDDMAGLYQRLAENAIYGRLFPDRPNLLRLGLPGSEEEFSRLENALNK